MARERLGKHQGRLAASDLQLEALLSSSVFGLVDTVGPLETRKVAVHCARLTDVVSSASGSSEFGLQSIVNLFHSAELGV